MFNVRLISFLKDNYGQLCFVTSKSAMTSQIHRKKIQKATSKNQTWSALMLHYRDCHQQYMWLRIR